MTGYKEPPANRRFGQPDGNLRGPGRPKKTKQVGEFLIEKGIPAPRSAPVFPFDDMDVGDSFFAAKVSYSQVSYRINRNAPKEWEFKIRTLDGGVRVWRVS